jgi:hypothetical protein
VFRLRAAGVAMAASVLALSGCGGGGQSAPVDQQPRLAALLGDVDDAITAGHFVNARRSLNALVRETESARQTGGLDDVAADQVLAAATQLQTQLTTSIEDLQASSDETPPPDEGDENGGPGTDGDSPGPGHNDHGHGKPDKPKPPKPDKND